MGLIVLFKLKLNRLTRYLTDTLGFDVDFIVLKNTNSLKYMLSEIYYPPPEEIAVHRVLFDLNSNSIDIYVSPLEHYRIQEIYGDSDVNIYSVLSSCTDIPQDIKCVEKSSLDSITMDKVSRYRRVAIDDTSICEETVCIDIGKIIRKIRRTKMVEELEIIKKAVEIAETALQNVVPYITQGINELMLASLVENEARKLGAEGFAFSPIIAIGENAAKPHHIPSKRSFTGREPILVDFGVRISGYVCDITRIIMPKNINSEYSKILDIIEDAIEYAISLAREGTECSKIDEEVRNIFKKMDLHRYFLHGLGHGIGIDVHEEPRITRSSRDILMEGDVVTIEPGIYIYGKYGFRLEDNISVGKNGCNILSKTKRVLELW